MSAASNYIELYFNDVLIDTITGDNNSNSGWSLRSRSVTGTGGSDTIMFKAAGISDSYGGSIDKVSMDIAAVPDPGSTLLLLGIAFVPVALSYRWWQK